MKKKNTRFYSLFLGPLDGDVLVFTPIPKRGVVRVEYGAAMEPLNVPGGMEEGPRIPVNRLCHEGALGEQRCAYYAKPFPTNKLFHIWERDMIRLGEEDEEEFFEEGDEE